MAIFNLGSINIDLVYNVPHFPTPGETLHSEGFTKGLGGKGANMSIAIAKAGGNVRHIGAVGTDGLWARDLLSTAGVDVGFVDEIDVATGHAVINVDASGENTIVLFAGANVELSKDQISRALKTGKPGDWLLLQNETSLGAYSVKLARELGMKIAYAAAPFEAAAAMELIDLVDLIAVNEIEANQLSEALAVPVEEINVDKLLVTRGSKGIWYQDNGQISEQTVFEVTPIDTTGAGDTYLGYFLAGIDDGLDVNFALRRAAAASSIQITRPGAAIAIPEISEVLTFLDENT
ncbi:MAG: ribokinase [Rhodobacteraceae bacterium]|nr:ribokinase [Paracoccaceae bacterium]